MTRWRTKRYEVVFADGERRINEYTEGAAKAAKGAADRIGAKFTCIEKEE